MRKGTYKYEKIDQKKRKPSNSKYWEMDTKYSEIPQKFFFRDFLEFLKKTEIPQK